MARKKHKAQTEFEPFLPSTTRLTKRIIVLPNGANTGYWQQFSKLSSFRRILLLQWQTLCKRNLDVVFGAFATTDQTHIVEEFNHRIRGACAYALDPGKFDRFNMQLSVFPCIDTVAISLYGMATLLRF